MRFQLWYWRVIRKANRLEALELIDLGCTLADVIALYESPESSEPLEEFPEATKHEFYAGPFHLLRVIEWQGRIARVTYESFYPDPNRDLKCVLVKYGASIGWREIERGYLLIRNDSKVRLWCSAFPIITVEDEDFFRAKVKFIRSQQPNESEDD